MRTVKTLDLSRDAAAEEYLDAGMILAEDPSVTDAEQEAAIGRLIRLAQDVPVPFIVKGRVKRLEDIKKYLYAGAKRVLLTEEQRHVYDEAAARFGADRLIFDLSEIPEWEAAFRWEDLKTNSDGLVPVVVQDYRTGEVLMLAYMNQEAYEQTIRTGRMTYFSRSRRELWLKGETSGHFQYVKSLEIDCDNDTILARVAQLGAACHTGNRSCFYRPILKEEYPEKDPYTILKEVYDVIEDRKLHPREGSYTNYLFDKGIDKILKKVGEEAAEIIIAAKNPNPEEVIYEMSDFLYHAMVLMSEKGITWEQVTEELSRR